METSRCDSPLQDPQGQVRDPVELVVSSAGSREGSGRQHISAHAEEPRQPPNLKSTEHPPIPAAMTKGNTGDREAQGQNRGVLGNCFIPISTICWSLIPGLITRRENPHHGTSLIYIPMKRELR